MMRSSASKIKMMPTHTPRKTVSTRPAPVVSIRKLKNVCNEVARIIPRTTYHTFSERSLKKEKASAPPIIAEPNTWIRVGPINRKSLVTAVSSILPALKGAKRKSEFSIAAKPSATVIM